jgi:signal transduction histidine kinase
MSNKTFMDKFQVTVPRELNRINTLVENLLELVRPLKMEPIKIRLKDLLGQLEGIHADELAAADIDFKIQHEGSMSEILGDEEHLLKAFSNLVTNAKQAMPEGGSLIIRAQESKRIIRIQFIDDRAGLDQATRDNMFNPFFATKDKGGGLNLAIAHKIIRAHGGTFEVEGESETGVAFTLTLGTCPQSCFAST